MILNGPGKFSIIVGGKVVGITDKPIHITPVKEKTDTKIFKNDDVSKSWNISGNAMITEPGDVIRDMFNHREKFNVAIQPEIPRKIPRKMKKAFRSDYRRNTKWIRKIRNYLTRNTLQYYGTEIVVKQDNKLRANEVDFDLLRAHVAIKGMAVPPGMKINTGRELILTKEQREKLTKIINND